MLVSSVQLIAMWDAVFCIVYSFAMSVGMRMILVEEYSSIGFVAALNTASSNTCIYPPGQEFFLKVYSFGCFGCHFVFVVC